MGSKLEAKRLMERGRRAGAPGRDRRPRATTCIARRRGASAIPVLVKAAFGGGGRGMRVVRDADELAEAVGVGRSARRRRRSATARCSSSGSSIDPRHIEVQIFGDTHGNVVHLFERECSIQRRHQKIIEEAPSPAVDATRRDALGDAAVAAAKAHRLRRRGHGRVRRCDQQGEFFFLEVNTRLQVEHPVTEMITGLDLVALQLLVAQGEPLPDRRGRRDHQRSRDRGAPLRGGRGRRLPAGERARRPAPVIPGADGVRVDAGFEDGSVVSTFYDAMLAKVIAWAPDPHRAAARRLAERWRARESTASPTNRDLLVRVLRHPEFLAGRTDTGFLQRHDPVELSCAVGRRRRPAACTRSRPRSRARPSAGRRHVLAPTCPSGWRNVRSALEHAQFEDADGVVKVGYAIFGSPERGNQVVVEIDGDRDPSPASSSVARAQSSWSSRSTACAGASPSSTSATTWYVDSPLGASAFAELPRFPLPEVHTAAGSLVAPMPGTVVRVEAAVGDRVEAGAAIVVIEAMKMEHQIRAPHGGTLAELRVEVGTQVDTGEVLAVVDEDTDEAAEAE